MRLERVVLRPALDLAATTVLELYVPCAGARLVTLLFRATNGNAPATLSAADYGFENTGFQGAGANIVETGDVVATQALNNATFGTTPVGRARRYQGGPLADSGGYFWYPWFHVTLTGHATLTINGLYIEADILRDADLGSRV